MNRITPLTTKRPKVTKNLEIRVFLPSDLRVLLCLKVFAARANFLDKHGYASDFIEGIRSHHEEREEHEVDGQED
jgi:hypothetical protein